MRISWRKVKGTCQSDAIALYLAAPLVTSRQDPCRPLYLEVRAVVPVSVDNLPLSPVPGQHRHHFSSCQVSVELGGEDVDAGSGQSLGEGWLKPLCPT